MPDDEGAGVFDAQTHAHDTWMTGTEPTAAALWRGVTLLSFAGLMCSTAEKEPPPPLVVVLLVVVAASVGTGRMRSDTFAASPSSAAMCSGVLPSMTAKG